MVGHKISLCSPGWAGESQLSLKAQSILKSLKTQVFDLKGRIRKLWQFFWLGLRKEFLLYLVLWNLWTNYKSRNKQIGDAWVRHRKAPYQLKPRTTSSVVWPRRETTPIGHLPQCDKCFCISFLCTDFSKVNQFLVYKKEIMTGKKSLWVFILSVKGELLDSMPGILCF